MFLHEDKDLFQELLTQTAEKFAPYSEDIIIPNFNSKEAQGDCNVPRFNFETPHIADYSISHMDPKVTLECSFLSPCAAPNVMTVDCFIQRFIKDNSLEVRLKERGIDTLDSFSMNVQPLENTFIDKVYALCDYYIEGKVEKHSRHLYDIYKMSPFITFDDAFKALAEQIRNHRASLDKCYSTLPDETRTIKELVHEFDSLDYYKNDYNDRTLKLIEEQNITYDMVIQKLNQVVAADIF